MKNQTYETGMYGGSFDPLHIGHIYTIIKASSMCKTLYVVISWCKERDSTSKELRYRWMLNSCKHLNNVIIKLIEDKAKSKEEYNNDYYWEKGAKDIKKMIGKKIDVVFCGSDYRGSNRFESLYGDSSDIIYFERREVPISSTELRDDIYKNWEYISPICKPHYVKKVLVVGGESTGKTTLVENLAIAYNTNFVKEVGRDICGIAGGEEFIIKEDLIEILLKQKVLEIDLLNHSNKLLFVDTDAITTLFYSKLLLKDKNEIQECENLATSISLINNYDLVLFLEPTVEFIQDGTRNEEIKNNRVKYSNQIKKLLKKNNIKFISLKGNYLDRYNESIRIIKEKFNIDNIWK